MNSIIRRDCLAVNRRSSYVDGFIAQQGIRLPYKSDIHLKKSQPVTRCRRFSREIFLADVWREETLGEVIVCCVWCNCRSERSQSCLSSPKVLIFKTWNMRVGVQEDAHREGIVQRVKIERAAICESESLNISSSLYWDFSVSVNSEINKLCLHLF